MNYLRKYAELIFWLTALILLAGLAPQPGEHLSLCLFHFIGLNFCPGCGLGRSIAFLFRGDIVSSFNTHPLGLFAVLVIIHRIYKLMKIHFFSSLKISNDLSK